jgi:hypothetical protein
MTGFENAVVLAKEFMQRVLRNFHESLVGEENGSPHIRHGDESRLVEREKKCIEIRLREFLAEWIKGRLHG